jgi:hypothetical protein
MIRLGRFQVSIEGLLALGLLVALSLGGIRCSAYRQGGDDARLTQLEQNAHKASLAGRKARVQGDSARVALKGVTGRVTHLNARLTAQGDSLRSVLAQNEAIIADSFATVPDLRDALRNANALFRAYLDSTIVLQEAVSDLVEAQQVALWRWDAERAASDSTIAAQRAVIRALERRECRVLGMRCPSRRTVFLGGAVATLLLVSVAR